jgi:hypothetical protein
MKEPMMTTTFATHDEAAAEKIRTHHAHLEAELARLVQGLTSDDTQAEFEAAQDALVTWLRGVLAPHAAGEESTFYRAASDTESGRLLIAGMIAEHRVILGLVEQVERAADPAVAAAWSGALLRVFASHAAKENDLVLPLLVAEPGVRLAELLEEMHSAH